MENYILSHFIASSCRRNDRILRRTIRRRLSRLHSVFIAHASARCKVHANTLYVTTKPIYFPAANSQRNTRGDVIEHGWNPLPRDPALYNFLKNPCPRIQHLPFSRPRVSSHVSVENSIFFPFFSQHFDCRNHIRVIQPMGDGNRLYMCGTNAHSPKDWVIYVSIRVFVLHFPRLFHRFPCRGIF